jgi:Ca2+/H+ antiporter, TMEM165/GDT1 family
VTGFIVALVTVLMTGLGSRDQLTLAQLLRHQGPRPGLMAAALLVTAASAAVAGWAAGLIAPMMAGNARLMLLALAMGFAGVESLLMSAPREAKEPTRSLAAATLVLAGHQLTDAARFLIFASGVAVNAPVPAAIGGAFGGVLLLGLAFAVPGEIAWARLRLARRVIGVVLLLIGAYLAMRAVGRI